MIGRINERYGPFCHGTGDRGASAIEEEGLRPRGWRESVWEELPSRRGRVYLASVSERPGMCAMSMEAACRGEGKKPWSECGAFYLLDEIPEELVPGLGIDEDALQVDEWCRTPEDSLEAVGAVSVRGAVERSRLRRLSPEQFFHLARRHKPSFSEGMSWEEWKRRRAEDLEGGAEVKKGGARGAI